MCEKCKKMEMEEENLAVHGNGGEERNFLCGSHGWREKWRNVKKEMREKLIWREKVNDDN